jgi:outer membrane lipoprotein-sorting protein
MRKLLLAVAMAALMAASAFGQGKSDSLETVLNLLDRSSVGFKTLRANFEWDQYQKVVDEHERDNGVMYFKRTGNNVDVGADIQTRGHEKKMVLKDGDLQVLLRKTGQVTSYDTRKKRESFESFLALGFGARGHDLPRNFDLRYAGAETVVGVPTYKLELVPKSQQVRQMFPRITLWIDQKTGMSVQQKLDQGEGDYRLAQYRNIEINAPLPGDAFNVKK